MTKYRKTLVFLIAIILGVIFGIQFYPYIGYVKWMGELFLLLLSILLIPIILLSIIVAFVNSNRNSLIRIGIKTICCYATTMFLTILTGLAFTLIFHPGTSMINSSNNDMKHEQNSFYDINKHCKIKKDLNQNEPFNNEKLAQINIINNEKSNISIIMQVKKTLDKVNRGAIVYTILIAFFIGTFIIVIPPSKSETIKLFFKECFNGVMNILSWIASNIAPFGVFGLIAFKCSTYNGNIEKLFQAINSLGMFILTNIMAMSFYFFILLSLLLLIVAKINPIRHMTNMFPCILTAFSTASSSAAMPLSLECLIKKSGVSPQTADFVMPLGSVFNMNGTLLFVCVTVISIYQQNGETLSITGYFILLTTIMFTTAGLGVMPMAGFCIAGMILNIDVMKDLSSLIIVDTILEMIRAILNIYGNSCCTVCIAHLEGEVLNTNA